MRVVAVNDARVDELMQMANEHPPGDFGNAAAQFGSALAVFVSLVVGVTAAGFG